MSINVIQLIQSALTDGVVRQLAGRFGLSSDATQKAVAAIGPTLVAAIMQKGATPEGARSLFSAIQLPEVNAQIGEQLPQLLTSTAGMTHLEGAGRQMLERVLGRRVDGLSDEVAAQTGVPAHAAHALSGIVGATVLGVLKQHFMAGGSHVGQLPTLLGHQLPALAPFLNDRLMSALGLGGVGAFTGTILTQLKAVSAQIEHPASGHPSDTLARASAAKPTAKAPADVTSRPARASRRWIGWLLAALAALLAFVLLRSCQHESAEHLERDAAELATAAVPQVASASVTAQPGAGSDAATNPAAASGPAAVASDASQAAAVPAPSKDSVLTFTVDAAGKPTVNATLGSEAEKTALIDALTRRFGPGNYTANLVVDAGTRPADWLAHLDGLLPLMALPGAEVKVDGAHIELSGAAADAKLGWLDKLKSVFGSSYQIGVFNVAQAVASATESFRGAIKNLLAPDASCVAADVAKVLNLQVINFASASAHLPASATGDLTRSAQVLNACARNGKTTKLEVAGYSDNVGGAQANLQLSKQRAHAVRAFLVKAGVPGDSLSAQGYGDVRPVATNATASGRFASRRIEFVDAAH